MKKIAIIVAITLFIIFLSVFIYKIFNFKLLDSKSELLYSLRISDAEFLQVYHTYGSTVNDYVQIFTTKNSVKDKSLVKNIENGIGFVSLDTLADRKFLLRILMKGNEIDSVIVNLHPKN